MHDDEGDMAIGIGLVYATNECKPDAKLTKYVVYINPKKYGDVDSYRFESYIPLDLKEETKQ